jgi:flavin-dependent dehydrogenase
VPETRIPESLAQLLEKTGTRLIDDAAVIAEYKTDPDVLEILAHHAKLGQGLVDFVKRTRAKGLVDADGA